MDVGELVVRDVPLMRSDEDVQSAAQAMAGSDTRIVLIGSEEQLDGILTEHDILIRVVAAGLVPAETRVGAVMSSTLFTCREDQPTEAAAAAMAEHRLKQMPVLDRAGRLLGLLTRKALAEAAGESAA